MKNKAPYRYFAAKYPSTYVQMWQIFQWVPNDKGRLEKIHVGCSQYITKEAAQARADELNVEAYQDDLLKLAGTQYFPYKDDHKLLINFLKVFISRRRKNHKSLPWAVLGEVLQLQVKKMSAVELAKMLLDV